MTASNRNARYSDLDFNMIARAFVAPLPPLRSAANGRGTPAPRPHRRRLEAVDREKQKRISRGALAWLRMLDNPDILFRFDVVEVIIADGAKLRLELIRNAFPLSKPYLY